MFHSIFPSLGTIVEIQFGKILIYFITLPYCGIVAVLSPTALTMNRI